MYHFFQIVLILTQDPNRNQGDVMENLRKILNKLPKRKFPVKDKYKSGRRVRGSEVLLQGWKSDVGYKDRVPGCRNKSKLPETKYKAAGQDTALFA